MINSQNRQLECRNLDVPGGSVVKNPPAKAGDVGSIPRSGRYLILYSSLIAKLSLMQLVQSFGLISGVAGPWLL